MDRHLDGLRNAFTRAGDEYRDRSVSTYYDYTRELTRWELDSIYCQHGLAARIIDRPSDDLLREGWELEGELDGDLLASVMSAAEDLELDRYVTDLQRWGRLYGGAILGVAVDDGRSPIEPLELAAIRHVVGFFVLDRHDVYPVQVGTAEPEAYTILAQNVPIEGRTIHVSRLRFHRGAELPPRIRRNRHGWGWSELQRCWDALKNYLTAHTYAGALLHKAVIEVIKLQNLEKALKMEGGQEFITEKLTTMMLGIDVFHMLALDSGDEYEPKPMPSGPIPELLDRFVDALVHATNLPRSILLGETKGGLNTGTNSGEIRSYYDAIAAMQRQFASPALNWALGIISSAKDGPTRGRQLGEYTIAYNPLWQTTDAEEAEIRAKNATADVAYVNAGIASVADVRETRFVQKSLGQLNAVAETNEGMEPAELDEEV